MGDMGDMGDTGRKGDAKRTSRVRRGAGRAVSRAVVGWMTAGAVAALALGGLGCGKKDGDEKGGGKKAAKLEKPNTLRLKSVGRDDKVLIDGEMKMGTVVVTPADTQGNPGLWMWKEGGGCKAFKEGFSGARGMTRVAIIFRIADAAVKAGRKPLPAKIKPMNSVIYHKGFNRILMSMGKNLGHVTILSGKLEPGTEVKGRVALEDSHGRIKGDFIAKVCPRK